MHYIRLLSPPKLTTSREGLQVEFIYTITTDLGDSFLSPPNAIDPSITAFVKTSSGVSPHPATIRTKSSWQAGCRIAKPICTFPKPVQGVLASGQSIDVCIGVNPDLAANGVSSILSASTSPHSGQIMPAWVELTTTDQPADSIDVLTRKIHLGRASNANFFVQIEEEIGESIARHIWDAGVVSLCAVAGAIGSAPFACVQQSCIHDILQTLRQNIHTNILELGCGVGVLGIGVIAAAHAYGLNAQTLVMTDLEEARSRAESNIAKFKQQYPRFDESESEMFYENLDWEDGRRGSFGSHVSSRCWDIIIISDCTYNVDMLPALVETLSSIHACNKTKRTQDDTTSTKVFLATKPRHDSERILFTLMRDAGWAKSQESILPLPVLGSNDQSVEMYMFEKR